MFFLLYLYDKPAIVVDRGAGPSCSSGEVTGRLSALKREIAQLDELEQSLDQQKKHIQQNLRNVSEDPLNHQYPFPAKIIHSSKCKELSNLF